MPRVCVPLELNWYRLPPDPDRDAQLLRSVANEVATE
jgi:hypothetical protein